MGPIPPPGLPCDAGARPSLPDRARSCPAPRPLAGQPCDKVRPLTGDAGPLCVATRPVPGLRGRQRSTKRLLNSTPLNTALRHQGPILCSLLKPHEVPQLKRRHSHSVGDCVAEGGRWGPAGGGTGRMPGWDGNAWLGGLSYIPQPRINPFLPPPPPLPPANSTPISYGYPSLNSQYSLPPKLLPLGLLVGQLVNIPWGGGGYRDPGNLVVYG